MAAGRDGSGRLTENKPSKGGFDDLDDSLFLSKEQLVEWIKTVVAQGIRRPGYPADKWAEEWIAETFHELGLSSVKFEPVPLPSWRPKSASLRVWREGAEDSGIELEGSALPYTTPTKGVIARLAKLGDPAAAGCIVVDELALQQIPQALIRMIATDAFDPDGEFSSLVQTLPLGPRSVEVAEPAIEAGAVGFVGALTGMPWETRDYYLPYDAKIRPIPGVWVSPGDSARMLAMLNEGPCLAELRLDAEVKQTTDHNVVAHLPGASEHTVIVASHHDGPWASAVEDGTGIVMVLAVAGYFANLPVAKRPHNLVFLLTAGHMAGASGTRAFIEAHRDLLAKTVLEIHLEHAALRCEPVDGKLVPTKDPEVRWWFTTQAPELEKVVIDAITAEGLRRSLVLKPDVFSPMPPTDGAFFHPEGLPLVNLLSAPMYLFDSCDTLDKVDQEALVPLAKAAVRIINGVAGLDPSSLRKKNLGDTAKM